MSTETSTAATAQPQQVTEGRWRLHPRVALRPEPFGALAYHYGNRKLNFLRSPDLVELVRNLGDHDSVADALVANGIAERRRASFTRALASLAASDFIQPSDPHDDQPVDPAGAQPS